MLRSVSSPRPSTIALLIDGIDQRLGRGLEPGPDQRPGGAEGQGGGHSPPVGDPAGGQHRRRCGQVHHDRHERQRGPPAPGAMPAALGALRHDDIGAEVHRLPGLLKVGDLDDQRRAGLADRVRERAGVAEGQHHRRRVVLQRVLDRADVDRPALEADAPRLVGASSATTGSSRASQRGIPVAAAQQSEAAAVGDRRRQRAAGRPAHRGQRDRMPHENTLGERPGTTPWPPSSLSREARSSRRSRFAEQVKRRQLRRLPVTLTIGRRHAQGVLGEIQVLTTAARFLDQERSQIALPVAARP